MQRFCVNPLNAKLNLICQLLALLGAHPILHVSRIRVNYFNANYCTLKISFFLIFNLLALEFYI
jgi:hypothetical protein